jgi:ComF family protein
VLLRLKYRRDLGLADALAPLLAGFVEQLSWKPHLIVPVPLGGGRIRQRGYNQAALIAQPLALALSIRYVPHDLTRTRETLSQVGLTRSERIQNVKDAFVANSRHVRDRDVLLVDDVATTGATLSACARALRLAGARGVRAVTVARASPSIHRDVWSAEGAGPVGSLYLQEAE